MRSASDTRRAVLRGDLSVEEVVGETFSHLRREEPALNAFLAEDEELALDQARDLQARSARGEAPGPLWGVPFSVKDTIQTAGMRTTYGSRVYADNVPTEDADVVAAVKRAGGILIGKTNTPEFAIYIRTLNDLKPETRNPWDASRISGGSSGGAAASAGAGVTPVAIGSDGGGSIRIPAALCGAVGLLPSKGAIPALGQGIGTRHFSSAGPLSLSAADARDTYRALAWNVTPGLRLPVDIPHPRLMPGSGRPTIKWLEDRGDVVADQSVIASSRKAAENLAMSLGWVLQDDDHDMGVARFREPFYDMMQADRHSTGGGALAAGSTTRGLLTDYGRHQFDRGAQVSGSDYSRAVAAQFDAVRHMASLFEGADVLATPTVPFIAPVASEGAAALPEDARRSFVSYTFLMNFVGLPAITIPCGLVRGMPVGLQLIGRHGTDEKLLDLAVHYQESIYRLPCVPESLTIAEAS